MTEFDGARAARAAGRERLHHALGGIPKPEADAAVAAKPPIATFDGGARTPVPPPAETHEQTLSRIDSPSSCVR
jgi:hypothetical protein